MPAAPAPCRLAGGSGTGARPTVAQLEGALERFLGALVVAGRIFDVFADDHVAAAELRPGWRETGILLDALQVQVTRQRQLIVGVACEVIATQVELVGAGVARRVGRRTSATTGER